MSPDPYPLSDCSRGCQRPEQFAVWEKELIVGEYGGLNMLAPGSSTIRGCGLGGVDVALVEEVYHCGGGQ